MRKYAIIGAAGYIASRHMQAIHELGGELVAAYDPHDSVGILDRWFPYCRYFREFERFDRFISKRHDINYVVVCSPNYLHDAHCRFGLRVGADVICEKPVVLRERNLDELLHVEEESEGNVYCILQMRLHPAVRQLREAILPGHNYLSAFYHVPRGIWYRYSWKGEVAKSGGVSTNIGSHLFDIVTWFFKDHVATQKVYKGEFTEIGLVSFKEALLEYSISVDCNLDAGRKLMVNDKECDFTSGFEDLHMKSYTQILSGAGYTLEDARRGVRLCEQIR